MSQFTTTLTVNFHCEAESEEQARAIAMEALPQSFDVIADETKQTD